MCGAAGSPVCAMYRLNVMRKYVILWSTAILGVGLTLVASLWYRSVHRPAATAGDSLAYTERQLEKALSKVAQSGDPYDVEYRAPAYRRGITLLRGHPAGAPLEPVPLIAALAPATGGTTTGRRALSLAWLESGLTVTGFTPGKAESEVRVVTIASRGSVGWAGNRVD